MKEREYYTERNRKSETGANKYGLRKSGAGIPVACAVGLLLAAIGFSGCASKTPSGETTEPTQTAASAAETTEESAELTQAPASPGEKTQVENVAYRAGAYTGDWQDEAPNGQRTYAYSDGRTEAGTWKDGKFID
jgi:hypothetical protein